MPDILTHLIGADEALGKLGYDVSRTIKVNRKLYNLGAQGPDLFFYHKIFPWQKHSEIERFGNMMHTQNVGRFFLTAADQIKQNFTGDAFEFFKKKDQTSTAHKQFAYLAGFLTHYALDTNGHPFIFYFSGLEGNYNHKYFECILDTIMNDVYDTKKMKLQKTGRAIKLSHYDRYVVAHYLSLVIYKTYNENIDHREVENAITDMKNVMNAMYDPKSYKKSGLKLVDSLTKAKGKIATAKFPAVLDRKVDYLNLKHQQWTHPCDDSMVYETSFLDCIKKGTEDASHYINGLAAYVTHQLPRSEFVELIGNRLYDTGLDANAPQEMKFSESILDYKKSLKIKDS